MPSKPRVRPCASCQPTARTSIPSSRSSPSSKTHWTKWHAEPSMHSGTQSELPSMTFPQKNASTIFAMPDMGPPNQDTLTDLPLHFDGAYDDIEMLASLDRIDSDGHY